MFHMSFENWHVSLMFPPKTRSPFILTIIILVVNKRIHITGILQYIIWWPVTDLGYFVSPWLVISLVSNFSSHCIYSPICKWLQFNVFVYLKTLKISFGWKKFKSENKCFYLSNEVLLSLYKLCKSMEISSLFSSVPQ